MAAARQAPVSSFGGVVLHGTACAMSLSVLSLLVFGRRKAMPAESMAA